MNPSYFMRVRIYRHHRVELDSDKLRSGEWAARACIIVVQSEQQKRIPVFGRRRATFATRREADAYALELAKLWIDGRTWGNNGHG